MFRRIFVVFVASALLSFLPATPLARAIEQTKLNAMVTDSLVFISIDFTGWVRVEDPKLADALKSIGEPTRQGPFEAGLACSGFVVGPEGYIGTAGHCVDPAGFMVTDQFHQQMAQHLHEVHGLPPNVAEQVNSPVSQHEWAVEGQRPGSPPGVHVEVIQPVSPGRVINTPTTVQLVGFQKNEPVDEGDNAVLKINGMAPLKPLVVADTVPKPGRAVTSAGFPGVMVDHVGPTGLPQPSFKTGTVSSVQTVPGGGQRVEISAAMSGGMSGGPTVDNETGQVLGVNSYGLVDQGGVVEQNFNMITDASALRAFLLKHGVQLAQPAPNKAFPWIWVIVGAVVVAALTVLLLLLRRPRGRRQPPQGTVQPEPAQGGPQPPGGPDAFFYHKRHHHRGGGDHASPNPGSSASTEPDSRGQSG